MNLKFRTDELTPAEASFLTWQFGYHDEDDPCFISLSHTINRAWISDHSPTPDRTPPAQHLARLGAAGASPEEAAVFLKVKSDRGEEYWPTLLQRAPLDARCQQNLTPQIERG